MPCPSCGEDAPPDAKFCEACGQDLNTEPLPACVSCGEREVAEEGYCLSCGHKQPEERDHQTFRDGAAVAVTDRGKRHRHNEDAVAIAETSDGVGVLVVCDGVSSTSGSAKASLRAASAARDVLVVGLSPGNDDETDGVVAAAEELLVRAAEAAQVEASASADEDADDGDAVVSPVNDGGSPSSTFVAVVAKPMADGLELTTAWVGDSRAYWVGEETTQLTGADHELGGSLVRWLGADSINPVPEVATTTVAGPGHVVVCSDGLWRYVAEPRELGELITRLIEDGQLGAELATALVGFANENGGHDNITVALWTNSSELVDEETPDPDRTTTEPPATTVNAGGQEAEEVSSPAGEPVIQTDENGGDAS